MTSPIGEILTVANLTSMALGEHNPITQVLA